MDTELELCPLPQLEFLAAAIKLDGSADQVFTGKLAIDDNASSVSQILAELLEIPHATVVSKFERAGENNSRARSRGWKQRDYRAYRRKMLLLQIKD